MSIIDNVKKLAADIEAGIKSEPLPPTTLKVDKIDTSDWQEFPTRFFTAPMCNSTMMEILGPEDEGMDRRIQCTFFSVVRNTAEEATARLRAELYRVVTDKRIRLYGFLSRPSTIELVGPRIDDSATEAEKAAGVMAYTDLAGPFLHKRNFAAFCFLFAELVMPLTPALVESELGLKSAVLEGQVHSRA